MPPMFATPNKSQMVRLSMGLPSLYLAGLYLLLRPQFTSGFSFSAELKSELTFG